MNEVENKAIKDQIYFERYKNGEANKVIELLDKSNRELAKYIKQTTDISSKKRYTEITRKLLDIAQNLKQDVESGTDIDGLIDYELKRQKSLLKSVEPSIKKVKGGEVNFSYPSRDQIKTAALFKPIDTKTGLTYQSFLEGLENGLYNTWDSALRTGYLMGMPTNEIVDYVVGKASHIGKLQNPGTMNAFRNSVYANTRTMLQSFANETMQRVYEENEKYFGDGETDYKYEYLACLDSRTCLVCGECDGKLYKKLEDCPRIPQHRGCRCVVIPYFNIEGDRRASKDGYVEDKVTYEEWLSKQNEKTQRAVLGATRYAVFKQGKKLSQFIDDGKILSLKDLVGNEGYFFFDKGEPMGFSEAMEGLNPTNDDMNCQTCTIAYEARLIGYRNVYALKYSETPNSMYLGRDYGLAWIDENGNHPDINKYKISMKTYDLEEFEKIMESKIKEGERYAFGFRWTNGETIHGHVVNVIRQHGEIRFIDAQTGSVYDKSLLSQCLYGKYIDEKYKPFLLRCDKLNFDEEFVEKILGEKK